MINNLYNQLYIIDAIDFTDMNITCLINVWGKGLSILVDVN